MKFCQKFGLTVFEYRSMPKHIVDEWSQMTTIEDSFGNGSDH